ncbi:cytochrome c [Olivibacter sp. SDN3]|nr:cytochrome c [Olivibacter sp. SDN3]
MEAEVEVRSVLIYILFIGLLTACQGNHPKEQASSSYAIPAENIVVRPDENGWPASFDFGSRATKAQIERLDISITPDGKGLPDGMGYAKDGALLFQKKCASCHGETGREGPFDVLVADSASRAATIGNYWPYATTIFDYIRRTMPYNEPGSLTNEEVYQVTAFLLYANGVINRDDEINRQTLPAVEMPAKKHFVADDRRGGPEVR